MPVAVNTWTRNNKFIDVSTAAFLPEGKKFTIFSCIILPICLPVGATSSPWRWLSWINKTKLIGFRLAPSVGNKAVQVPSTHLALAFDFNDTTVFKRERLDQGLACRLAQLDSTRSAM